MRKLVLQQKTLLYLIRLKTFQLVYRNPDHSSTLKLLYLFLPAFVEGRQSNILLAEPHHSERAFLFKNATLAQLVLTIFLQKSTFLLFLFCLRQAAMLLPSRPRSYGTGGHFDSRWNLFWDRFERPGRVSISCALYKSFAYVGFPLLLKEGACFF